ncbi:hypothetical protein [Diaminobutyricibacter sp. McL0608]|uniref:hypothetical protein n=1 Tax=Leifsonia sp. McL0608 TaxID=3143537 RepID=UPI0031F2E63C
MSGKRAIVAISADTRLAWTIGGALLIVSPILSLGSPSIGSQIPGGIFIGPVCFAAATVLFAFGIRGSGSVTARRPLGTTAVVFLGLWTLLTAVLLGPIVSTIYAAGRGGVEWTFAVGYANDLIQFVAALIAAIQIARAGVVPRPWNWAPTWALVAITVPWLVLQIVGYFGAPAVANLAFAFSTIDGLINLAATLFLGVVAIVLAQVAAGPGAPGSRVGTTDDEGHGDTNAPGSSVGQRNLSVVLLLAFGALTAIGGVIGALAAKAAADHALFAASGLRTLPVYTYTQFTQAVPSIAPELAGMWVGSVVAVLGVAVLLAGVIVATRNPPLAS